MRRTRSRQVFSATVRKVDINPYVRVPAEVVRKLQQAAQKDKGPIRVEGKLQGQPFSATVVRFRGLWRLYLNTAMRREAQVGLGDQVRVEIEWDATPHTVPMPRQLKHALSKNKRARAAFQALAPSRRKEILRYLNHLKRPETLQRNIEKVIRFLQAESASGPMAVSRARRPIRDRAV